MKQYGAYKLYPAGHLRREKNRRKAQGHARKQYKQMRRMVPNGLGPPSFVVVRSPEGADSMGWRAEG